MKIGVIYRRPNSAVIPRGFGGLALLPKRSVRSPAVYDHVVGSPPDREPPLNGPYTDKHPFHDPLVMLAYLAAITERIELVTGVLILPERQTTLVARQAADLDLLSHERLRLGVGIGWNYVEYAALGQDFASRGRAGGGTGRTAARVLDRAGDQLRRQVDTVDRAALNPRPRRQIPLWMGGFADVALRRAARLADGFIFADGGGNACEMAVRLRQMLAEEDAIPVPSVYSATC
jgi:probable F420-dependent oxidoreductase